MLCSHCGQQLSEQDHFCYVCGAPVVRTKKVRLWPAFLSLILIFSLGFSVFLLTRTDGKIVNDDTAPWFTLQNGVLYFDEGLYTGGSELTVPETINGQTVTAISEDCFEHCTDLVTVYLPDTIAIIGDSAFYGCKNLRGIRLPESLVSIGDYAFGGCVNLEAICIPYSLEDFGNHLFSNCHKLVYFFYPGPISDWYDLPLGHIREDSYVYCADGICPAT